MAKKLKNLTFLVVEDSESAMNEITKKIKNEFPDCNISKARSKNEALELLNSGKHFDILIIDIEINIHVGITIRDEQIGLDLIREIREKERREKIVDQKELQIIAHTASTDDKIFTKLKEYNVEPVKKFNSINQKMALITKIYMLLR